MNLLRTYTTMSDLPQDCIFTERQIEILQLWSQENSVQQVAERLNLSHHTINTQLKRMRKKIEVNRTVDLYIYARNREWVE